MVPSPRRLPHPISRSLSRRRRLILGEEKEPEVNQRGLGRRRPFPQGDQRFESVSLQRRVCLTSTFHGYRRKGPALAGSVSLDETRERDVLATSGLTLAAFLCPAL